MAVESDDVAVRVITDAEGRERDLCREPVVTFCGWVKVDGESLRLFIDPWFVEWFVIPTAAVVHQVTGSERAHDEGQSAVWVLSDAAVSRYVCGPDGVGPSLREEGTAGDIAGVRPRYDKPPPRRN